MLSEKKKNQITMTTTKGNKLTQLELTMGADFNHYFECDNYDAMQPDRPIVPESDAEIEQYNAEQERNSSHAYDNLI